MSKIAHFRERISDQNSSNKITYGLIVLTLYYSQPPDWKYFSVVILKLILCYKELFIKNILLTLVRFFNTEILIGFSNKRFCLPWLSKPWVNSCPTTAPIAPNIIDLKVRNNFYHNICLVFYSSKQNNDNV